MFLQELTPTEEAWIGGTSIALAVIMVIGRVVKRVIAPAGKTKGDKWYTITMIFFFVFGAVVLGAWEVVKPLVEPLIGSLMEAIQ